jgi:hypothetical protein
VAVSHKSAMMPQVILQDNNLSCQDAANEIKFGLILLQEAAKYHRSVGVAMMPL